MCSCLVSNLVVGIGNPIPFRLVNHTVPSPWVSMSFH